MTAEEVKREMDIDAGRGSGFSPVFKDTRLVRFSCDECSHEYCRGQKSRMIDHQIDHMVERKMRERGL